MTDTPRPDWPDEWSDEDEALAAEYALGLLDPAAAAEAERRSAADARFRAAIEAWQERLAGLTEDIAPVAPRAAVRAALGARLFGPPPSRFAPLLRVAGFVMGAAMALAVVALVSLAVLPFPPAPSLTATLAAEAGDLRFEAVFDGIDEVLTVRRVAGDAAPQGRAHELWLIGPDGVPASLGLIGEGPHEVGMLQPPPGWTLAVSLEPEGGSPTGAPTGPVLAAGPLTRV